MTPNKDLGYSLFVLARYLKSITCETEELIEFSWSDKLITPVCPLKIPWSGAMWAVVNPKLRSSFNALSFTSMLSTAL